MSNENVVEDFAMADDPTHPCRNCGACCAYFRVSFYWAEADDCTPDGVPLSLTVDINDRYRAMAGTESNSGPHRCAALLGGIPGALCTIYKNRPSPCQDFAPSWENGEPNDACDRARAHFGLPPLTPHDFHRPLPWAG